VLDRERHGASVLADGHAQAIRVLPRRRARPLPRCRRR
jgi:hypothetical protein